jgi:hypothetical protein
MRPLRTFHRHLVIGLAVCVVLAVSGAVVAAGGRSGQPSATRPAATRPARPRSATTAPPARPLAPAPTVTVPQTAIQKQIDGELAQAETSASITAAEATSVPAPAVSASYPSIPTADRSDPTAYAIAFTTELLDTNYAAQSRAALLAWAEHEQAPNTLPGVPASVAGKALVLSLADPNLPGGTPSPTPSAAQWVVDAKNGVVQTVTDVQAQVDPDWTQIVSEGWQPRDPLMTIETVTGTLTVTTKGQAATPVSFTLTLTLGSAAHVHGYGAVAAGNWTAN